MILCQKFVYSPLPLDHISLEVNQLLKQDNYFALRSHLCELMHL